MAGVGLGFKPGQVVQEFYWDEDVDNEVRSQVEGVTGHELADVDYPDIVDGAIVWWRADDAEEEDLADVLVDVVSNLDEDGGVVWVLTPKPGSAGHVSPSDVQDAAEVTGMQTTSAAAVGSDWTGTRLAVRARMR